MCWFIDVTVVPQKATLAGDITMPQIPGPEELHGKALSYSYYEHHCACKTVSDKRFAGLVAAVNGFCDQPAVKRVEVRQYWASDRERDCPEHPITQSDFVVLCTGRGFEEGVCYRISPDRFHQHVASK